MGEAKCRAPQDKLPRNGRFVFAEVRMARPRFHRLFLLIPAGVFLPFKRACKARGATMTFVVARAMQRFVEESKASRPVGGA